MENSQDLSVRERNEYILIKIFLKQKNILKINKPKLNKQLRPEINAKCEISVNVWYNIVFSLFLDYDNP